jgi:hypothetical protein
MGGCRVWGKSKQDRFVFDAVAPRVIPPRKGVLGKLQFDPNSINELIFIGVVRVIGMALYSEIRDSNKTMSHVRALYIEPSEEQRWFAILNQLEIGIRSLRPDGPLERTNDLRSQ